MFGKKLWTLIGRSFLVNQQVSVLWALLPAGREEWRFRLLTRRPSACAFNRVRLL